MDEDTATRFVSSLVKSIQALCNGYIEFSTSIEVIGHIHLNIDRNVKFDYVLTEEVSKSLNEAAAVFASHSYNSRPPPPPSTTSKSTDSFSQTHRKSQVTQNDDSVGSRSHSSEVPNTQRLDSQSQSSNRVGESSDSHSGNAKISQDTSSNVKLENNKTSCQVQESLDKRRKNTLSHRTPSPAAKRIRNNDSSSSLPVQNPGFDEIEIKEEPDDEPAVEIKEEPDDEPAVYFGDSSSHVAAGQDIQTPDFSNVVMENLDSVGQIEGTQLVAGGGGMMQQQQQQQPFPVMLHANSGMPSSTMSSSSSAVPGPSLDPRSTSSTSGGVFISVLRETEDTAGTTETSVRRWETPKERHCLQRIPVTGKTVRPQKRCIVCRHKGVRRKSRFFCPSCPGHPGFCRTESCFMKYHQMLDFEFDDKYHILEEFKRK